MKNALLDELENISVYLKTHWDQTKSLWDDCVRDQLEEKYIQEFLNTIQLCLKGNCGPRYVFGRGMFEFFQFIMDSSQKLSAFSGEPTTFDSTGEHALTVRFPNDQRHKKKYTDEEEEEMAVDYDEYPPR